MNRPLFHQSYGPGKFEGEDCTTRFAYNDMQYSIGELIRENTLRTRGPFSLKDVEAYEKDTKDTMCVECIISLLGAAYIDIWESSDGFVEGELVFSKEGIRLD